MRVLVLGSAGMVGHTVSLYLKESGHDVDGFSRKANRLVNTIVGDAADTSKLEKVICSGRYDYVINCIGELKAHAERDKAGAVFLNSYLPHFLASITMGTSACVLHMSTDCVFSGEKGNYAVDDFPDGRSFYNRSKALGEIADDKNITLRCSVVGPDINPEGIGLVNWFMKQKGDINGFTDVIWTGQTSLQLAKTMEAVMNCHIHGIYNSVPKTTISKYELLKLFNQYLRCGSNRIIAVDSPKSNKSLISSDYGFDYAIPDYEKMIKDMADWMQSHNYLYPHYYETCEEARLGKLMNG